MKTHGSIARVEILKYLAHGYDLKYSVNQAKSVTLHRFDQAVDRAAKELSWWNDLHQEGIEKIASAPEWFRPSDVGYKGSPEVLRDLLSVGVIECELRGSDNYQKDNEICFYKKSLKYLQS